MRLLWRRERHRIQKKQEPNEAHEQERCDDERPRHAYVVLHNEESAFVGILCSTVMMKPMVY